MVLNKRELDSYDTNRRELTGLTLNHMFGIKTIISQFKKEWKLFSITLKEHINIIIANNRIYINNYKIETKPKIQVEEKIKFVVEYRESKDAMTPALQSR